MAKRKVIPKTFSLMGRDIKVIEDDNLVLDQEALGLARLQENLIAIQARKPYNRIAKQSQEQTFHHELVHCFLYAMGEHELNTNEKFVDLLGSLIHQYFKTSKY